MNKDTDGLADTMPAWLAAGDFIQDLDLSAEELADLLSLTHRVKCSPGQFAGSRRGRYLSMIFEKPSLRTRVTFELAIKQLGGDCVFWSGPVGGREPVKDVARNLDRWTQCIVARTFSQKTVTELARWSEAPVINALSDLYHPCQALADMFTLEEHFGRLRGLKLAFIGDGNNVAHSLMLDSPRLGIDFAIATPARYRPQAEIVTQAAGLAETAGTELLVTSDPAEAVSGAHAVYTDVWASMGREGEADDRRIAFAPYQVTESMMEQARPEAVFMHCLPARRGEETLDAVMESPRSVVFDQAANRLHTQKALLLMLLK